jgi:FAD-linked sulfhydryl oxidase
LQSGLAIAPKLGNETIKAELGRASWKLFHTMMAQFPDKPKEDESRALKEYIYLFQRLYPCGECANHFGEILKRFPPQVSSRSAAAVWACHVHNEVNKSLKKELFDCANIGEFYDCGCADDKKDGAKGDGSEAKAGARSDASAGKAMSKEKIEKLSTNGRDLNEELLVHGLPAAKVD